MWRQGFLLLISFNAFLCWKLLLLGLPPLLAGPELLEPNDYWLPGEVVPVHYDLKLVVHMDNLTTRGEVVVMVKVAKATSNITLHANSTFVKIDHDKVAVKGPNDKEVPVRGHSENGEKEFYTIELGSRVDVGQNLTLTLPYTGVIRDGRNDEELVTMNSTDIEGNITRQHGFYASPDGEWGLMASTKFEPNGARLALPCFDEPRLKATFTLSLARSKEYSSLGNMPLKEEGVVMEEDENYLWDHYEKSVPMSTYLFKWVVSKYDYADAVARRNITIRAFYGKNMKESMSYAAHSAALILEKLEEVFKIDYQLPKMDMVVVPFFRAGAMEDWGLMSFRIHLLQYDEEYSTKRFRVDDVISHELVHQWTGNLVTCAWWDHIWLNEGFASYFEYIGIEAIYDKSFIWQYFYYHDQRKAMQNDVGAKMKEKTTVPATSDIRTFQDIGQMFTQGWRIYERGACMLHMLRSILGDEAFFSSVTSYLTENSYSSAVSRDLWKHMEDPAKKSGVLIDANMTIQSMMEMWVNNSGFPEVNVVTDFKKNVTNAVSVYQYRLQWRWTSNDTEEAAMLWPLWLTFTSWGKGTDGQFKILDYGQKLLSA